MLVTGNLVETGQAVEVRLEGASIDQIRPLDSGPQLWIAPGLMDIQVNGYAGHDFNSPDVTPQIAIEAVRSLWSEGVTGVCPTVITQSEAQICHSLRAIVAACEADPLVDRSVLCIHVEGPYISPEDGPRGAHPAEHVRPPSLEEYRRWQEVAGGRIGIITLAPEHPGACEYINGITSDGVVAAIGHTAANGEQIRAAVYAGARFSTHLGNGSHDLIKRHPNYIWDQLAEDNLSAGFIFDGHHLPPAVMKSMLRAKGVERSVLVSDASAVAGLPPGVYGTGVGRKVELLPNGRLNMYGTPYMAGSASALKVGVANALRYTGIGLADAVRLATANPAQLLDLDGRGSVRAGAVADLTVFRVEPVSQELEIELTVVGGDIVYRRDSVSMGSTVAEA